MRTDLSRRAVGIPFLSSSSSVARAHPVQDQMVRALHPRLPALQVEYGAQSSGQHEDTSAKVLFPCPRTLGSLCCTPRQSYKSREGNARNVPFIKLERNITISRKRDSFARPHVGFAQTGGSTHPDQRRGTCPWPVRVVWLCRRNHQVPDTLTTGRCRHFYQRASRFYPYRPKQTSAVLLQQQETRCPLSRDMRHFSGTGLEPTLLYSRSFRTPQR